MFKSLWRKSRIVWQWSEALNYAFVEFRGASLGDFGFRVWEREFRRESFKWFLQGC